MGTSGSAIFAALLLISLPEMTIGPVTSILHFITSKFALFSFSIEFAVAIIASGLQTFFGLGSATFNAVTVSCKTVASSIYYFFSGMGAFILFGNILHTYLGHWILASELLIAAITAYIELYIIAVPAARWLLGRPSVI